MQILYLHGKIHIRIQIAQEIYATENKIKRHKQFCTYR